MKNNLIQLYLYTHVEIKFLHLLVKEGRHGAKKTKNKKNTHDKTTEKESNYSHFFALAQESKKEPAASDE